MSIEKRKINQRRMKRREREKRNLKADLSSQALQSNNVDIVDDQQRRRTNGGDACVRQLCGRNDAALAINPYHLDPLSVYARISFGSILLSLVVSLAPLLSLFPFYILIIMVVHVSSVAKCNDSHPPLLLSLIFLLHSSFSPPSLLFPSFTLVSPHHQLSP